MNKKTIIIAEAGVNHNGSLSMAMELVDVAAQAGADFVKFQTFSAEQLVTADARKADYQQAATGADETQFAMLKRLELSEADHRALDEHCRKRGIGFLSTGFDTTSLDFLISLGIPMVKIPSGEITNLPYLRHVASLGKSVILSTGMSTMDDVAAAIRVLESGGVPRAAITVLHCTTEYPAAMADVNLNAMVAMRQTLGVEVGYSDHTLGIEVAIAAVAMGAVLIEKHFTLDCSLPGPDHQASLEPDALVAMVQAIRNIEIALGDGNKRPQPAEEKNRLVARRSIVAARAIAAGEVFSDLNICAKRPGTGVSPMNWDRVVGSVAQRNYAVDELIDP